MDANITESIEILQDHLADLRKIAGWSADELSQKLGVTKQNISMLENKKNKMTQTQYIAIRFLFDSEVFFEQKSSNGAIQLSHDVDVYEKELDGKKPVANEALLSVLKILFDDIEKYKANKENIDILIHRMALSMSGDKDMKNEDRNELAKVFLKTMGFGGAVAAAVLTPLALPVVGIAAGTFLWTNTILKLGKKK